MYNNNKALRYAFIHRLLSNLTDNEIQTNILDNFYNQLHELDLRKVEVNNNRLNSLESSNEENLLLDSDSESMSQTKLHCKSLPGTPIRQNRQSVLFQSLPTTPAHPKNRSAMEFTKRRHSFFTGINPNDKYDSVLAQLQLIQSPKKLLSDLSDKKKAESTQHKKKTSKSETSETITLKSILAQLNQILERDKAIKAKTAKDKLLSLLNYLLSILATDASYPIELMHCIFALLGQLQKLTEKFESLAFFKTAKDRCDFMKHQQVLLECKNEQDLNAKITPVIQQDFNDMIIACYIGRVMNGLYSLREYYNTSSILTEIDQVINKFLVPRSSMMPPYEFYTQIFYDCIKDNVGKIQDITINNLNQQILTILMNGFIQLQLYADTTDWRYLQSTLLIKLLTKKNHDDAVISKSLFQKYLQWMQCKDLDELAGYAITIIKDYRIQKLGAFTYFDKQLIRSSNAILKKYLLTEFDHKNEKVVKVEELKNSIKTQITLTTPPKIIYSRLHQITSPYFLNVTKEDNTYLEPLHLNYIKTLATDKLNQYLSDRKNKPLYFIYDLFYKGDLGANTIGQRKNSVTNVLAAIGNLKCYADFHELINSLELAINKITDNTSKLKAKLRSISYRIYKTLDKIADHNNEAKQIKFLILEKILNPYIAETFGSADMNFYPESRKIMTANDSFMGILTKIKFIAENIYDDTQYRRDSVAEFIFIKSIHSHLSSFPRINFDNHSEIAEFYTNLFELIANAATNVDNINLLNKISEIRNILIKLFNPLNDPHIDSMTLPFSKGQLRRIKDSLESKVETVSVAEQKSSIFVNSETNVSQFKNALAVQLQSHLLANVVLSTGRVARKMDEIDGILTMVNVLGNAASIALGVPHNVLGLGITAGTLATGQLYDRQITQQCADFAQFAARPSALEELVDLIVDKVIERYNYQIANQVHAIDIKKYAQLVATRILSQCPPSQPTTMDSLAEELVHNIWRFPKYHNCFGLSDETVLSQNDKSLKVSKLCTRTGVAIQVTGFFNNTTQDIVQFYHRPNITKPEKYGYVTYTAEFQLKILQEDEFPTPNLPSTYYLKKSGEQWQLYYSADINTPIRLSNVPGLNGILSQLKTERSDKELIACLATYHGKKCAESFDLDPSANKLIEIKFLTQLDETTKQLSNDIKPKANTKNGQSADKQLEVIRFFHCKLAEKNSQTDSAVPSTLSFNR